MNYLTTAQAAKQLGVSVRRITAMIDAGNLRATRIGRDWLIDKSDLMQRGLISEAQEAWRILGITPRVWNRPALSNRAVIITCPQCDSQAYKIGIDKKYTDWAACPSCKWAEKPT